MGKTWRVLVVDDEQSFHALARELLGGNERVAVVGSATDADSAVTVLRSLKANVALVDVNLRKESGFACAAQLLAHDPQLIIVFTSVENGLVYRDLARVYGGRGFVSKRDLTPQAILALLDT